MIVRTSRAVASQHFFFFFQAEDGIRDADVTGVQTCALPILEPSVQSDPYSHYVKDPKDLRGVSTALFSMMDEMGMTGRGAVFVDSLTEMFTLVQADSPLVYTMLDGIKSWRAKGPKERLVPFF